MPKSVALKDIINEVHEQIEILEDELGTAYRLTHNIGDASFFQTLEIMKDETGYIPKLSGQVAVQSSLDLKFKVKGVAFSLKHTLSNTLNLVFDYRTKAIEFSIAPNEDGSLSSINSFTINGHSEIHDSMKNKLAVLEGKKLVFLDQATLVMLQNELSLLHCASRSTLNEFNALLSSPSIKKPLKLSLDKKFKEICKQAA